MNGMFCVANAKNNEEYKQILKRRNVYFVIMALAGIAAIVISVVWQKGDFTDGFVMGTGCGLVAGAAVLFIRNMQTLKSEDKIKAERLKNCDERNVAVSMAAIRATMFAVLICCYIACVVFAFINPLVTKTLATIAVGAAVIYVIMYRVYSAKM